MPPSPPQALTDVPVPPSRCPAAGSEADPGPEADGAAAPPPAIPPRHADGRGLHRHRGGHPHDLPRAGKTPGGGTHRTSVSPPLHPTEVLPGPSPCLGAPEGKLRHGAGGAHPGETPPSTLGGSGGVWGGFWGGVPGVPQGSPQQHGRPLRPHGQVQQPVAVQVEAGVEAAPEISQPPPPAQRRRLDALRGEARAAPAVASPLARIGLCRHRSGIGERFWGGGTPKLSPGMDRAPPSHPLPNFSPACSGAGGCRGRRGRRRRRRGGRPPGGPPPGRR